MDLEERPVAAAVGACLPIAVLPSGICWAPYGHAGGRRALFLGVEVLGRKSSLVLTAGDDGGIGILFLLECVTVRILTYIDGSS